MTTRNLTVAGTDYVESQYLSESHFSRVIEIDFTKTPKGSGDIDQAFAVDAGDFIEDLVVKVEAVEGGTQTVDIGDGTDPDGFLDGSDLDSDVGDYYSSAAGSPGYVRGKLYEVADTIDILYNNAAIAGKIKVTLSGHRTGR